MINFHAGQNSGSFKYPVNLFLITPHEIPVIVISLFPVSAIESLEHAVPEIGLELDVGSDDSEWGTVGWGSAIF